MPRFLDIPPLLDTARARRRALRAATLTLGLAPAAALAHAGLTDGLGANPVEAVTHETGRWALRFLVLCLAVTPIRRLTGWRMLVLERRTLGLFAFGYAGLHLAIYLGLDLGFAWSVLGEDVLERPFITVGFASFLVLLVLACTSTRGAMRRLGRRWKPLHRAVHLAAIGAVLHFAWGVKADLREPLVYASVVASLLGIRLWWGLRPRGGSEPGGARPPRCRPAAGPPLRLAPGSRGGHPVAPHDRSPGPCRRGRIPPE